MASATIAPRKIDKTMLLAPAPGSEDKEMLRQAAMLTRDLHTPNPVMYWGDCFGSAAIGYAAEAGLPFELGIIRNHYVGRTFIEPTEQIRHLGVKLKHNANQLLLKNKRVVLVDDSIVRGTTSTKIVEMVRSAGAMIALAPSERLIRSMSCSGAGMMKSSSPERLLRLYR